MNILFISPNSPRESIGGVERYLTNLIKFCNDKEDLKTIIVLPSPDDYPTEILGSVTINFDKNLFITNDSSGKEISEKAKNFSRNIEEIISKHGIDVIVAENFNIGLPPAFSLVLNMVASSHSIPLVLHLHSFATTDLQIQLVTQLMWDKISCVSKSVSGDIFQKGANIDILTTDYLGVDTEEFNTNISKHLLKEKLGISSRNKIVLTASRIILGKKNILKEKGIINTIQAFSKISPRHSELTLLIAVGKCPENLKKEFNQALEMLVGYIKLHNIGEKTIIKSFELKEMAEVYRGSDVFVLPSENETFGQVFIEAMACGLPVIGTKVGGIPEIITDNFNGVLITPDDSSILAQTIEKIFRDNSIKDKFVRAAEQTVNERFTASKQFGKFFKMLETTVSKNVEAK